MLASLVKFAYLELWIGRLWLSYRLRESDEGLNWIHARPAQRPAAKRPVNDRARAAAWLGILMAKCGQLCHPMMRLGALQYDNR